MGNDDWVVVGTGQQSPTGEVKSVIGGIITHTPGWLGHADWFENMVVRDEAGRFADQIGGIGSIARADIPDTRLPDPTPITFMGRPVAMTEVDISNVSTTRAVTAFIPIKDDDSWHAFAIGVLTWDRDTHEVELAFVQADVRRTGVATALYEFARTIEPDLKHSPERSPSGSAFAASIDPDLPKATRPLSDADAHAMGSRLMVAVTGFGSDDTIGEPALATRKPPTIAQGPVIGERIGVPLTDISQIRPGSGTYEGTVAPDAPRVFRNVGNIAELDQAIRVGSWNASTGGFTVRAMEGDTQFTADYEQAKRWKHHLRNEVGNRLLIEADITGLPVRFIGREEAEPTDAYGHEWPQTLTSTHFYPSTSTGIGVVGDIPLDRIKNVSMLRDDGSVHEFGSWDAFVTWREGGGPYVAQGPIVEAPDSVMLEAHLGQVLARFQEPAGVRDLFGTGGDAESPTMTFEQRLTHCYDLSASALFYGAPEGSKLVHGTIHGWGAPRRIGHGWLELPDGKVWEPITAKVYDKNEWTIWAGAEVERVYTKTEAVHHLVDSGHYGRWHDSIYPAPLPPGDPTTPLNDQIMWEHRPVQGPLLDVLKAMVDPKFDGLPQEAIDKYHATLAEADAKESGGVQRWYDKNGAGLPGPRRDQLNQVLLPWDPTHRLPKVVDPDFPALAAALVARDVEMLRGNAEFMLEDARRRARLTAAYYEDQRKYREWAADLTPITDPGPILSLDAADTRISIAHGDEGQPRLSQAHGRFARVLASALPQGYSLMFYGREDTGDSGFADGTQFVGNIMHEGHIVGHFDRQDLGNGDVYNRHLDVVKEGIGLGTQWVARSMEAYRAAGYKRLHVRAGLESGGIVWAKAGFEFDVITPGQDLPTGQLATSSASGWGQHPLLALEVSQDPEVVAWRTLHPVDYQREATGGYGLPRPRISPSPREMHDAGGAVRQLLIGSEWTGIMDLTEAKSGEPTGFAAFLAYIAEHPNGDPEAALFDVPRQPATTTPEVKGIGGIARHAIGALGDAVPNRGGWWAGTGFREDLVVRDTEGRFVDRLGIGGIALAPLLNFGPETSSAGAWDMSGLTVMQRGTVEKILDGQVRVDGQVMTRREHYAGMTGKFAQEMYSASGRSSGKPRMVYGFNDPDGGFYDVSKLVYLASTLPEEGEAAPLAPTAQAPLPEPVSPHEVAWLESYRPTLHATMTTDQQHVQVDRLIDAMVANKPVDAVNKVIQQLMNSIARDGARAESTPKLRFIRDDYPNVHARRSGVAQAPLPDVGKRPEGEVVRPPIGTPYIMQRRGKSEYRYYPDGSLTVLDTRKKGGTNRTIAHTGANPDRAFDLPAPVVAQNSWYSLPTYHPTGKYTDMTDEQLSAALATNLERPRVGIHPEARTQVLGQEQEIRGEVTRREPPKPEPVVVPAPAPAKPARRTPAPKPLFTDAQFAEVDALRRKWPTALASLRKKYAADDLRDRIEEATVGIPSERGAKVDPNYDEDMDAALESLSHALTGGDRDEVLAAYDAILSQLHAEWDTPAGTAHPEEYVAVEKLLADLDGRVTALSVGATAPATPPLARAPLPPDGPLDRARRFGLVAGINDWETTKPWERSREDFAAGLVPGFVLDPDAVRGWSAMWDLDHIVINNSFFDGTPESLRSLLYHEAGHGVGFAITAEGDIGPLMAPLRAEGSRVSVSPFRAGDLGSTAANHDNHPSEILADAYGMLANGSAGYYHGPGTDELFAKAQEVADAIGFPTAGRDTKPAQPSWDEWRLNVHGDGVTVDSSRDDDRWTRRPVTGLLTVTRKGRGKYEWTRYATADGDGGGDHGIATTLAAAQAASNASLERRLAQSPPVARAPLPSASKMVPAMPDWYFADQAHQYPPTGPEGVSYFKGVIDSETHVDCLLFYKDGALVGILNHFPQDFPAAGERKGNITVIVDPGHRRQRIGAELTAEAVKRWDVDLHAQDTTPMGRAFLDAAGPTLNPFTGGDGVAQYATIPSTLGWLIEVAVRMAGPGDDEPKGPSDPPRVVVPAKDPALRRPSRFKPLKSGTAPKMSRPYGLGALIGVDPPVRPARRNLPGGARGYLTLAGGAGLAHGPILDTKPDAKPTVQDVTTMPLVLPRSSEGVALTPGTKAIMALHTFKRLFPDADPHHRRHVVVTQVGRGAVDVEFSNDPRYGEDNTNLGPVTVTGKDLFAARNSVIPKGYGHNGRQIRVGSVVQMGQGYVGGADRTGSYGVILSKGPDADDPTEEMWEIRLPDGQVVNKWASTLRVTTTTHKFNHDAGDAQVGDVLSWVASDGNLHKDKILAVDTAHDGTVLISFAPPTKDKPNPNGLILGMPTPSGPRPETVTLLRFRPNDPVALTRLTVHTSQELNAARNKAVAALPSDHNLIGRRKQMFADDPELVRLTTLRDNQSIRAADWAAWRDGAHANTLKLIEPAYDLYAEPPAGYPWPMTSADVDVQIKQDTESAAHLDGKVNEFRAWVQGTDPSYVRRGFRYEPDIALDGGPGEATLAYLRTVTEVGATLAEAINARYLAKMDVADMVDPDVARARRDVLDRQSGDTYRRENDVREAALLAYALEKYGMSDPHTQAHEIVDGAQRDKVIVDLFGLEQQHERAQSNPEWLALMEERKAIYAKVDKINLDMHVAEGLARANRMHAVREILAEIRPTGGTLPLSHPLTPDVEPLHLPMDEVQVGDKMLTPQGLSVITAISREGEAPDLFEGLGDPDSELTRLASLLDERPWILTITDPNGKSAVGILSAEHVSARNATLSVYRGDVALTETPDPVALEALTTALSMYPTSWVKSAAGRGPLIVAPDDGTRRGSFNDEKNIISLPKSPEDALTGPGEIPRLRAATHEVGHLMEVSVPGLKAMEWAFHTERTTDRTPTGAVKRENGLRSRTGLNAELPLALLTGQPSYGGEMARGDQYPMPYTGKGYGDGPSAMREMFTTMVESLLAGSAYGDEEMLAWALGVLATL